MPNSTVSSAFIHQKLGPLYTTLHFLCLQPIQIWCFLCQTLSLPLPLSTRSLVHAISHFIVLPASFPYKPGHLCAKLYQLLYFYPSQAWSPFVPHFVIFSASSPYKSGAFYAKLYFLCLYPSQAWSLCTIFCHCLCPFHHKLGYPKETHSLPQEMVAQPFSTILGRFLCHCPLGIPPSPSFSVLVSTGPQNHKTQHTSREGQSPNLAPSSSVAD